MKTKKYIFILLAAFYTQEAFSIERYIFGKVTDEYSKPIQGAKVVIEDNGKFTRTNEEGIYQTQPIARGNYLLTIETPDGTYHTEQVGVSEDKNSEYNYQTSKIHNLEAVEIVGEQNKVPKGLEQITRLPIDIFDNVQNISIITNQLIEEQGVLTITDAVKNIPGVTKFASYGTNKESMTIRGYRGTPVLKNGVRMDSDFRTASAIADMSGVESIQVIKGSAAITQGIGNDLGSAGGVINVITKTPQFVKKADLGLRTGSWLNTRLQYDLQTYTGKKQQVGFRLAGAFQGGKGYKDVVRNNRIYIHPAVTWRPDNKTDIIMEMDYLRDRATPDRGTVNLAPDSIETLYDMKKKFTGFKDDLVKSDNITYSIRAERKLSNHISARVGFFNSYYTSDQQGATISLFKEAGSIVYNKRNRGIGRSYRKDYNSTLQVDLLGREIKKGIVEWSWQVGYDHNIGKVETRSATGIKNIDVIDVYQDIDNSNVNTHSTFDKTKLELGDAVKSNNFFYGFMTQQHVSISEYVKLIGGLRWSYSKSNKESVLDPVAGIMISPLKNINVFGSYTTTSNLRSSANPLADGGTVGISRTHQYEIGAKSLWLDERLSANITFFKANNKNLSYQLYDENQVATGLYGLAGNLKREGVEIEVSGQPTKDLQVMAGYAYTHAYYESSPAYMDGSAPMNTPKHTTNAWVRYRFSKSVVKGLSLGAGVYYVGKRPVNEYTKKTAVHNTIPGVKYFDMPAYTTLDMQIGYKRNKFEYYLYLNNITNALGYTSYYRGGYINPIEPFNFSVQVNFKI